MKKKVVSVIIGCMLVAGMLSGCGNASEATATSQTGSAVESTNSGQTIDKLQGSRPYNIKDYVKLCEYKNIKLEIEPNTVTEDEINEYVDMICGYYSSYNATDKTLVEEGDYVNIDYVGTKDGVAFDGGTSSGYELGIGSGNFIPGFESGLVGHSVGETVELNLTFPENYGNEELNGKDVVFTVTINSIDEKEVVDHNNITDAYVIANLNMGSVEEFKEYIETNVLNDKASSQDTTNRNKLAQYMLDNCEVVIPDGLQKDKTDEYIAQMTTQLEDNGNTLDEYISQNLGVSYEEFYDTVSDKIGENLKLELILEAIASDSNLSIDEDTYQTYINNSLSNSSYDTVEKLYEMYTTQFCDGEMYMRRGFLLSTAYDNLINDTEFIQK